MAKERADGGKVKVDIHVDEGTGEVTGGGILVDVGSPISDATLAMRQLTTSVEGLRRRALKLAGIPRDQWGGYTLVGALRQAESRITARMLAERLQTELPVALERGRTDQAEALHEG